MSVRELVNLYILWHVNSLAFTNLHLFQLFNPEVMAAAHNGKLDQVVSKPHSYYHSKSQMKILNTFVTHILLSIVG